MMRREAVAWIILAFWGGAAWSGPYTPKEDAQVLERLRQQHASLTAEWEELVLQLEQQA